MEIHDIQLLLAINRLNVRKKVSVAKFFISAISCLFCFKFIREFIFAQVETSTPFNKVSRNFTYSWRSGSQLWKFSIVQTPSVGPPFFKSYLKDPRLIIPDIQRRTVTTCVTETSYTYKSNEYFVQWHNVLTCLWVQCSPLLRQKRCSISGKWRRMGAC